MSLSEHVSLTITQDTVGVARAGFGIPLILSMYAAFAERVRFYTALVDVADDFAVTTPEYLAARAMFSQSPKPEMIAIGRAANKPTAVYTLNITAVRNSYTYSIDVVGEGVTTTTVEYTSDASATDGEIVAGLVAALNLVTGKNFTAAGATSPFTVTANAAGEWFSLEVNPADIKVARTDADPGVATDLTAIALENDSWYALCAPGWNSNAQILAIAAHIEAIRKIYIADCSDSESVTLAVSGSDTLDDLKTAAYARTAAMYHPSPADMAGAAWLGRVLPIDPGSDSWKYKTLAGVNPVTLTATHRVNLRAKKANTYQTIAGLNITWEGTTADGDFIDVQRGLDWIDDDMTKSVYEALAGSDKIPYTNAGVAQIEGAVRGSLSRAVSMGILADDPEYTVTVPLVSAVSNADKALRLLPDVKFSATLAGAVHKVEIDGVVSL